MLTCIYFKHTCLKHSMFDLTHIGLQNGCVYLEFATERDCFFFKTFF